MILGDVFERFAQQSPITVMARAVLENALAPQAVDQLFETVAERQYTRTLLFSSIVDLMGTVVCRIRPAINAAYHAQAEAIGVSLRAVYGKLDRTEPGLAAELDLKQAYWDGALEHHPCNFRLSGKGFPRGLSISSERHSEFHRFGFCLVS